jgi:transmembrane sensor
MTTTNPVPATPAAQREAARWAALLDRGTPTEADRAALDQWLQAAPEHRPLLSRYCQLSADLETVLPELLRAGALDIPAPACLTRPWWRRAAVPLAAAAALVLAAVVLAPWRHAASGPDIVTLARERSTVSLADGSQIELNARTHALVRYDRARRQVRLIEGEALFGVAAIPDRPFVVDTPAGEVTVTGTRFNVRLAGPAELEVTVLAGTVQVRPPGGSAQSATYTLRAGDQLVTRGPQTELRHLPADTLANATAWREGRAVFEGTPLAEAAARFAHYHGFALGVAPEVRGLTIGGRFTLDDLPGFLAAVEQALPMVRAQRAPDGTVHFSRP